MSVYNSVFFVVWVAFTMSIWIDVLRNSLHTQLDRLLDYIGDLDQINNEMDESEYSDSRHGTIEYFEEFSKSLEKMEVYGGLSWLHNVQLIQNVNQVNETLSEYIFLLVGDQMYYYSNFSSSWSHSSFCQKTTSSIRKSFSWGEYLLTWCFSSSVYNAHLLFIGWTWYKNR